MSKDSIDLYTRYIHPLYVLGKSDSEIAKELGVEAAYIREVIEEASGGKEAAEIYQMLLDTWSQYIEFASPWNAKILSVYQFQSYFYRILPAVFYVGMTGPAGSAKTAVLEILRDTCENGIVTINASVAAIARKLGEGCTLLLDEADEMDSDKKELVYAAARAGYRPGNNYLRYDYKKNAYEEIPVYGPKGFSFLKDIDAALATRTFEIPTIKVKDDPFGKVLGNLARGVTRLHGVKERLKTYCARRLKLFAPGEVLATLESESFRSEVERAVGLDASPRDIEKTATALLVTKIAGIDLGRTALEAIESQATLQDELQSEVMNWVKQSIRGSEIGSHVMLQDLRDGLNRSRKESGEKAIHHKQFRAILREAGLREGMELKRKSHDGRHVLIMTEQCRKMLNLDDSPESFTVGIGWFTEALVPSPLGEVKEGVVKNNEDRVNRLLTLVKGLSNPPKSFFTLTEVVLAANGIADQSQVESILKRWKQDGILFEPKEGEYRFV